MIGRRTFAGIIDNRESASFFAATWWYNRLGVGRTIMTVNVRCPTCGEPCFASDESAGTRGHCQRCGQSFTVSMALDDTTKPVVEAHADRGVAEVGGPVCDPAIAGRGMMGHVYLAYDPNLEREVAVKVLPPTLPADETRRKRFLREAKLAARIQHTNVAQVHQAGIEGPFAYIAMEFVPGQALRDVVAADGPLPWREATRASSATPRPDSAAAPRIGPRPPRYQASQPRPHPRGDYQDPGFRTGSCRPDRNAS